MLIVDANVLLYAVDEISLRHAEARHWLEGALASTETVGFAMSVLLAFLRLSTKPGIFAEPLSVDEAQEHVTEWLRADPAVEVRPGRDHVRTLCDLLRGTGTGGNLVQDAHLAALAIEHRATMVSFDRDFGRFPVRLTIPA